MVDSQPILVGLQCLLCIQGVSDNMDPNPCKWTFMLQLIRSFLVNVVPLFGQPDTQEVFPFIADHPFLYLIKYKDIILFSGTVFQ